MPRLFGPGPSYRLVPSVAFATALFLASAPAALADSGYATWYGPGFQGNVMASGQIFDMYDPTTTACNIYPMGTWIQVTNPDNGRAVVVQVRDTGGFHHALDLSFAAFRKIADPNLMEIPVSYHVVSGPAGDAPRPAPASPAKPTAKKSSAPVATAPTHYVVQPGDTLANVADQFGVSARSLADWNSITDPNLVAVGQTLRLTPGQVAPPPAPVANPLPSGAKGYTVQDGDTLSSIADKLGVTNDQLIAANALSDPDHLVTGQILTIPAMARPSPRTYVVQAGDSLKAIAASFGVSVAGLASLNQIGDPDLVQPGARLVIPAR